MSIELDVFPSSYFGPVLEHPDNPSLGGDHHVVARDFAIIEEEETDIYRGDPPVRPISPIPESVSSDSSSTTSTSSAGSSVIGRRLGAIAAVVEHAIARWARNDPSESSSSSDSSSNSSIHTVSKSHISKRRRQRRPSVASLHNAQSERQIATRIKAREASRQIAREFVLYLPGSITSHDSNNSAGTPRPLERVSRTTALPVLLNQLDAALKKSTKTHRAQDRSRLLKPRIDISRTNGDAMSHHDYMLPDDNEPTSRPSSFTDLTLLHKLKKGKRRENGQELPHTNPPSTASSPGHKHRVHLPQRAWWLDVASPTWEDMRAIGKLLHLHPLTLEDILQQDPREKLELFPKLGYYFVVFKALESKKTRERFFRSQNLANRDTSLHQDDGFVGEANVYLVVFREGVCSFHFTDISEHTDRVRNKLLLLDEDINMSNTSSDWIAHGILDSIVDSFFPFQEEIEKEVAEIEDLVFSNDQNLPPSPLAQIVATIQENRQIPEKSLLLDSNEKQPKITSPLRTRFAVPAPTTPLVFRRLRRFFVHPKVTSCAGSADVRTPLSSTAVALRRMAKARRLLTTSTRLLGTKSEVVAQIRKRLLTRDESGLPKIPGAGDETEVAMYMGDVQDHILTLQHSLVHYERILSQLHPTYLSLLRVSGSTAKQGTDKAIMVLSTVSIAVLCCQAVIGFFSMNVRIPANAQIPGYPYNMFGTVLAISVVALFSYFWLVRRWRLQAKRRRRGVL